MEQKSSTSIKVAIRIRPLIPLEKDRQLRPQWNTQENAIYQIDETGQKYGEAYSFDHIFGMHQTNSQIYNEIVKDFVGASLDGLNSTIFAYGQTSSGKTYTMLGHKADAGIMSLAIDNIFKGIENNLTRKFLLRVSYIEIYNEKINDLLDTNNKDLKIREFFPTGVGLQNAKEELVSTREDMYSCLKIGNSHRHIGSTKANERSSRSHTIFKITIESTLYSLDQSTGSVQVSSLNLVDLAGSERVAQTRATGMRLKEGGHINKSLSALSLVIKQLSDGQEFVNFRDSKLTRLLQDSLGGNSKTLVIATITVAQLEDTASTLAFAQRAKTVKNKPHVNEILTDADVSKRYAALNAQLQKKLEEQVLMNQKIQDESNKEMVKLRHQMAMLEEFQGGTPSLVSDAKSIPNRRHTIGFSEQKARVGKKTALDPIGHCYEGLEHLTYLPDLTGSTKGSQTMNVLETIMEEELATPRPNHRRTSSFCMATPLSVVEDNALLEAQEEWRLKEQEMLARMSALEERLLQNTTEKNESLIADYSPAEEIMDQLICLRDVLCNPDFVNNTREVDQEDSVLEIIEKFNAKVKTSKDIIENEILKQINFQSGQERIKIPNELASFNDLLVELSSFENIPVDLINNMKKESVKDFQMLIKVYEALLRKNDLIKMCSEKIKILEEDQRKTFKDHKTEIDRMIAECEKNSIGQFEWEERCITLEEELEKLRTESKSLKCGLEELARDDKLKANEVSKFEMEQLKRENEGYCRRIASLHSKIEILTSEIEGKDALRLAQEAEFRDLENKYSQVLEEAAGKEQNILECSKKIATLTAEIREKEELMFEFEAASFKSTQDRDRLNAAIAENQRLQDGLAKDSEEYRQKMDALCSEVNEKKRAISDLEIRCLKFEQENGFLKCELAEKEKNAFEAVAERERLEAQTDELVSELTKNSSKSKQDAERLNQAIAENDKLQEEYRQKIDSLQCKIVALTSEIDEKNKLMSNLETSWMKSKQDADDLNLEFCNILEENKSLKRELDDMRTELAVKNAENRNEANKEKMHADCEGYLQEIDNLRAKMDALTVELNEKNSLLSAAEASSVQSKKDASKLKLDIGKILEENKSLKCQLENQIKDKENRNMNAGIVKNKRLQDDLEKVKLGNVENRQKIMLLQIKINALTSEINEKNNRISELEAVEASCVQHKQDLESLKLEYCNIRGENKSMKYKLDNKRTEVGAERNKQLQDELEEHRRKFEALTSAIGEKNDAISALEGSSLRSKQDAENLKLKYSNLLEEHKSLKCKLETAQNQKTNDAVSEKNCLKIETLTSEIDQKNAQISELETTTAHVKHEYSKLLEENKSNSITPDDLIIQRHKQLYKSAQSQIADLKTKLTDHEKVKQSLSRCKVRVQEYSETNDKLRAKIHELENRQVQTNGCDEASFKFVIERLELILCSIIEGFIGEEKVVLSVRHSQDQRDSFKNILRDLKATGTSLKQLLSLLKNHQKYEFEEIKENVAKCRGALHEYFSMEKSLLQEEIRQLDCCNKEYLQEIIALKNQNECLRCNSVKQELSKLKESHTRQEQTFSSLKSRNEVLEKEHKERMKEFYNLQVQLYSEQDRKAEVQYSDYMKFLQDNDKSQQKHILKLERENEAYRKMAAQKNPPADEEALKENIKAENYKLMKAKYIKRGQEMAALKSELAKLKMLESQKGQ